MWLTSARSHAAACWPELILLSTRLRSQYGVPWAVGKRETRKQRALVIDIPEKQADPSAHLVRMDLGPFNNAA
jgi:hypothetical protein